MDKYRLSRPQMPKPASAPAGRCYREYWYLAFLHDDRIRVWRLENIHNQADANSKAMTKLGAGRLFYAFMLNTADMSDATAHARAWFVENGAIQDRNMTQGQVLDKSLHRASHIEKPIT
jgi:hypothetical protein